MIKSRSLPIGHQVNFLTVISEPFLIPTPYKNRPDKKATAYQCRCVCGKVITQRASDLTNLKKPRVSCGCKIIEKTTQLGKDSRTHGRTPRRLYNIWSGIITRCINVNATVYKHYGAKGIVMCNEWRNSYESFRNWSLSNGYQETLELDRIDNNGGYNPNNCRWTTRIINMRNTSRNSFYTAWGETKCISAWFEDSRCVVRYSLLVERLVSGINPEIAISTPANSLKRRTRWYKKTQ